MIATTLVSRPKGSWKWQTAYAITAYKPTRTRDGRVVWKYSHAVSPKLSWPQLQRGNWHYDYRGSLHGVEITGLCGSLNEYSINIYRDTY